MHSLLIALTLFVSFLTAAHAVRLNVQCAGDGVFRLNVGAFASNGALRIHGNASHQVHDAWMKNRATGYYSHEVQLHRDAPNCDCAKRSIGDSYAMSGSVSGVPKTQCDFELQPQDAATFTCHSACANIVSVVPYENADVLEMITSSSCGKLYSPPSQTGLKVKSTDIDDAGLATQTWLLPTDTASAGYYLNDRSGRPAIAVAVCGTPLVLRPQEAPAKRRAPAGPAADDDDDEDDEAGMAKRAVGTPNVMNQIERQQMLRVKEAERWLAKAEEKGANIDPEAPHIPAKLLTPMERQQQLRIENANAVVHHDEAEEARRIMSPLERQQALLDAKRLSERNGSTSLPGWAIALIAIFSVLGFIGLLFLVFGFEYYQRTR